MTKHTIHTGKKEPRISTEGARAQLVDNTKRAATTCLSQPHHDPNRAVTVKER
jgi:hypothetical protein